MNKFEIYADAYKVIERYRWQYSNIYPSVDSFLISVRIMNEGEGWLEYISNYELQTCSAMRHDWYERKSSTRSDYELISKVLRTPHHCLRRVAINNRQDVQLLPFHESKVR